MVATAALTSTSTVVVAVVVRLRLAATETAPLALLETAALARLHLSLAAPYLTQAVVVADHSRRELLERAAQAVAQTGLQVQRLQMLLLILVVAVAVVRQAVARGHPAAPVSSSSNTR